MSRAFKDFRNELKQRKGSERQAEREREAEAQQIRQARKLESIHRGRRGGLYRRGDKVIKCPC
jgi:hypothetical protein